MVATRRRNYGAFVRTPPRRGPRQTRPVPEFEGQDAIWKLWQTDDLEVMAEDGMVHFSQIQRQEYPEVRNWVRENLNYELPAWDPLTQLAPATIPRGIVNGFEAGCQNLRSARILWFQDQGRERGFFINPDSEEARAGAGWCGKDNTDCQFNEDLDFTPCQGHKYGLVYNGEPCGIWLCTDCAEHEYKQWDFSLEDSRILVHCWPCSQDATKSSTKAGNKSYAEQVSLSNDPDNSQNRIEWGKDAIGFHYLISEAAQRRRHCGCRKLFKPAVDPKKRTRSCHLCYICRQKLYERCMEKIVSNCQDPKLGLTKRVAQDEETGRLADWVNDGDNENRNCCRCDPPSGPRDWPDITRSYRNLTVEERFTKGFRMCLHCKLPTRYRDVTAEHRLADQGSAWW